MTGKLSRAPTVPAEPPEQLGLASYLPLLAYLLPASLTRNSARYQSMLSSTNYTWQPTLSQLYSKLRMLP